MKRLRRVNWFCGLIPRRIIRYPASQIVLDTPPERPDHAIYSQREMFEAGGTPTWDNPDIRWDEDDRSVLHVKIRNYSGIVPATGDWIHCDLASSRQNGIGLPRSCVSSQKVNVGIGTKKELVFQVPENHWYYPVYISLELPGECG